MEKIAPHKRLTINVHLDGMRETHDYVCAREGVFDEAIAAIRTCKELGYHVITNTTIFKETKIEEVKELCDYMEELGTDGMLISPGYQYESVDKDIFLTRQDMEVKFQSILELSKKYRLTLDADVPRVRGRSARLSMLAVEYGDLHAQRLEGALLSHRQETHLLLGRVLE